MADISVTCGKCGRVCKVSEFAAPDTLKCRNCGERLVVQATEKGDRLRVKKLSDARPTTLTGLSMQGNQGPGKEGVGANQAAEIIRDVHKVRQTVKGQNPVWGFLLFLVLGGLLVGWQYLLAEGPLRLPYCFTIAYYQNVRLGLLGITTLLVLIMAFEDSWLQGILCVLLPFYILYYVFARMENLILRGAFAAVYLALGMELYYMADQSMLLAIQNRINQFIVDVGNLIQRASDSPI